MLINSSFLFIIIALFSSCSYFGKIVGDALHKANLVNTSFNQNVTEGLSRGENVIIGRVRIFYEKENITERCGIVFGSGFSRGGVSFRDNLKGDLLFLTKERESHLSQIICTTKERYKLFTYYFKEMPFTIQSQISYIGQIDFYFTSKKINDGYKTLEFRETSIAKLLTTIPQDLQRELERVFNVPSGKYLQLIY